MEARVAVLEEIAKATKESLGRIETKLETIRDKMERDFRLTFGAIIAVALGLAFVIAKGLKWF